VANHKSAQKRARQDEKRRLRNRHVRSGVRRAVRRVRSAASAGDADAAGSALRSAERVIRKAASKGIITKKQASRTVSRLARRVHVATAPPA